MYQSYFYCLAIMFASGPVDAENAILAKQLVGIVRDSTQTTAARVSAARALGQLGVQARVVITELAGILNHPSRGYPFLLDEALVQAVGKMGAPAREAIPSLIRNAGRDCDLDRAINESVAQILRSSRAPVGIAVLIEQLKSPVIAERLHAAKELAALGIDARDAARALTEALADGDPDVRRQAYRALLGVQPGAPPSQPMLGVLVRDLTDNNEAVRLGAAKALARLGPVARPALDALKAAAKSDPDDDVRRMAGDAIGRILGTGE